MITVKITDAMREAAQDWYSFGSLKNSYTRGAGNIYGALGEIVFLNLFPQHCRVDCFNHDFNGPMGTVEVKTKRTTVVPQMHYLCSVAELSEHQHPDWYVFMRVSESKEVAYFLGAIDYKRFLDQSVRLEAGEFEPGTNFRVKFTCLNIPISRLDTSCELSMEK